jgi:hypothetical protein
MTIFEGFFYLSCEKYDSLLMGLELVGWDSLLSFRGLVLALSLVIIYIFTWLIIQISTISMRSGLT